MGIPKKKKKKKEERKNTRRMRGTRNKIIYTKATNGHPLAILPKHVGSPSLPELVPIRKPHNRRRVKRNHKTSFDVRNQVIYYIKPGGDGYVKLGEVDGDTKIIKDTAPDVNRKGRPRGSKNKSSLTSFNYQCEKRSFTYSYTNPMKCKSCDRTFDVDPLVHCLEYHKSICPICGRSYKSPLVAHIKSHGTRQVSLAVTCYECYDCKEKFGNATTMAKHVLEEHVSRSTAKDMVCCICDSTAIPNDIDGLREHVTAVHSKADTAGFPERCGYCNKQMDRSELVGHLIEKHLQKTIVDLQCMLCGVQLENLTAIVDHLVDVHCPQKTFTHPAVYRCRVCQAGFKSQINVLRHACNKIKSAYCEQCDKTFPSKMRYAFHLQFHEHPKYASMHLHCDLCLAEFEDEYHLYDHIRFRHELHDKAVCEICGRTFKSSMGLNIHRRYHTGSRNFTCKSCDKSFLNKSTLKEHEISHMEVKPFQCHICGQYLSRASRLRSHVKTHKAAESTEQVCYCCNTCGFVAPNQELFSEHSNKEHNDDSQANAVELLSVVKCEFCDSTYMNATHLNNHRNTVHANSDDSEAFICVVCSSTFSTYSRLTTHKLTHGINMESALASNEPSENEDPNKFNIPQFFSCQFCAKMCLHYTYFCLHRRLKHPLGVQAHTCDRCFLDFKTSWRLSYHKKTVHGQILMEKPPEKYKCSVCSRKFIKIGALNLHKTRTHIDIVGDICKYLCHQCGKFFSSQCSLKNHAKVHTNNNASGEQYKPAVTQRNRHRTYRKSMATTKPPTVKKSCPYCPEITDDKAKFIEHVNQHIQSKPILPSGTVCELCDENFENSAKLKFHLDNHASSNEAFLCTLCYVPFLSRTAFDVHITTQCTTKPHPLPDVQFVGTPKVESNIEPLVVDCSKIFKEETTLVQKSDPVTEILPNKTNDNSSLESSVLDELLAIISTPHTTDFPETIDYDSSGYIDDLFNSISN